MKGVFTGIASAVFLAAIAAVPVRADRLDTAFEKLIGPFVAREFAGPFGIETDPLLASYIARMGASLAKESPRTDIRYRYVIIGSDVANAYTLPGGYIFVTRGLLDSVDSDEELASVLAHETGHVEKRHATQQIGFNLGFSIMRRLIPQKALGRNGDTLLAIYSVLRTLNKSKEHEAQADVEGIKFAYAAGYDPGGLVQFFDGLGGYTNRIEEYFATHPSPKKRIADARKNPLVTRADTATREHVAEGYAARGYAGLAEVARRGEDPFIFPLPPASPQLPDYLQDERKNLTTTADDERKALLKFYNVQHAASIAQQFLVLNTQLSDPRWIYLAGRAYAVQGRISDLYSRSARTLRTAPGTWDALTRQALVFPAGSPEAINGNIGRGDVLKSLETMRGVATPLSRAQTVTAAVLLDLNNRFVRLDNTTSWVRYGALEGTLRYAESELDRVDARSGRAWRWMAIARIRRFEARLNELVPENDPAKRAIWHDLLQRRIGAAYPTEGPTGMVTIRAMLSVSLSASAMELAGKKDPNDTNADWVLHTDGAQPENVATAMRLLTLDLERELAARERYKLGTETIKAVSAPTPDGSTTTSPSLPESPRAEPVSPVVPPE